MRPEDHLGLVVFQVRRLPFCGPDNFEDLFQVGVIGLIKACRRWDGQSFSNSFSTYATKYIRGEIFHYQRTLIGRTDQGKNAIKPHANACSLDAGNIPEKAFYDSDQSSDEWEAMKVTWLSPWEKSEIERKCLELVITKGLTRQKASEILGINPMKTTRVVRSALTRLHQAYLSAVLESDSYCS